MTAAEIPGGWVKLWRKVKESGWLQNHKLWAFWSYCLLSATHKPYTAIAGCQQVQLEPGQFIFGRNKAAEETGLSPQEVRTCKAFLEKAGNLTSKSTNKFSIITIVNWGFYQSEPDEATSKATNGQPATNHIQEVKKVKKKETPSFFDLLEKYAGEERTLIDQTLQAIAATRKGGKIADTVKASILQQFEKFDRQQVLAGCKAYLEKNYNQQNKNEKYLFGIIRNTAAQPAPAAPAAQAFQSTGSKALDDYYRNQTAQGAIQ